MGLNRNINVDAVRGSAIVLVVLGHSIQLLNPNNFDSILLFRLIYSFHMPLFMMISGFTTYLSWRSNLSFKKVMKRILLLIIPFFVWSFIVYIVANYDNFSISGLINHAKLIIIYPDTSLWFLWILSLNTMFLFFSIYVPKKLFPNNELLKNSMEIILGILTIFLLYKVRITIPGLSLCDWHFKFFVMGYMFCKYEIYRKSFYNLVVFSSFIIYLLLGSSWYRTTPPNFINTLSIDASYITSVMDTYNILVALSGSVVWVFIFVNLLSEKSKIFFAYLGRHTIEIYILSNYFIRIYFNHIFLDYIISIIIAIYAPIIIKKVAGYIPILNFILFSGSLKGNFKVMLLAEGKKV